MKDESVSPSIKDNKKLSIVLGSIKAFRPITQQNHQQNLQNKRIENLTLKHRQSDFSGGPTSFGLPTY